MATFVFENMTQAQANAVTAADIIAFSTTSVNARNVAVTISAAGDTITTTTITVGTKSLAFDQQTLSDISELGNLVFNDNSALRLGTNNGEIATDFDPSAANANTIYGFAGTDTITATNTESFIYGNEGGDSITGGSTADHLYGFNASGGSDGADSINGGDGGDYIQGNSGADVLNGQDGSDRVLGGAGNDTVTDSGTGNDSVNGNTGNDQIDGGSGDDFLRGGQGNDQVLGGTGNDKLFGDLGTDTLNGGVGVDEFTGGAGADVFTFTSTDANPVTVSSVAYYDTVLDYTDGEDEFRITNTAGTSTFGDAASSAEINIGAAGATFTTVSAATTYAQQLLDANTQAYDVAIVKVGSDTYLFYDSTGVQGTAIDSIVKLQGVTDTSLFTQADFG